MPSNPSILGTILSGRYRIEAHDRDELLGQVYRAFDTHDQRTVALKVLDPELRSDPEAFERFGREITNTYMVGQENTVEVLDWGSDGDQRYLVLEFLLASPLERTLELGPMSVDRAACIAIQIARALGAAHQEGIVHRALNPETVLLLANAVDGDFVKVRDFGMSKLDAADEETALTTQNTRVGEAAYMAPEYIQTGQFHLKGDLYALGALLHRMLTGRPLFSGTPMDVLGAQIDDIPVAPSSLADDIPQWMDRLVADLVAKNPAERPGAYKVVQRLQTGLGTPFEPPELLPIGADGQITQPTGPPLLAIVLGVGLLVVAGLALVTIALFVIAVAWLALGTTSV